MKPSKQLGDYRCSPPSTPSGGGADAEDQAALWTTTQARAYHDGCLEATLADPRWERKAHTATSCHTSVALEILRSTDPENEIPATSTSATSERHYILFFDKG
jgi:hypothetical protein